MTPLFFLFRRFDQKYWLLNLYYVFQTHLELVLSANLYGNLCEKSWTKLTFRFFSFEDTNKQDTIKPQNYRVSQKRQLGSTWGDNFSGRILFQGLISIYSYCALLDIEAAVLQRSFIILRIQIEWKVLRQDYLFRKSEVSCFISRETFILLSAKFVRFCLNKQIDQKSWNWGWLKLRQFNIFRLVLIFLCSSELLRLVWSFEMWKHGAIDFSLDRGSWMTAFSSSFSVTLFIIYFWHMLLDFYLKKKMKSII